MVGWKDMACVDTRDHFAPIDKTAKKFRHSRSVHRCIIAITISIRLFIIISVSAQSAVDKKRHRNSRAKGDGLSFPILLSVLSSLLGNGFEVSSCDVTKKAETTLQRTTGMKSNVVSENSTVKIQATVDVEPKRLDD